MMVVCACDDGARREPGDVVADAGLADAERADMGDAQRSDVGGRDRGIERDGAAADAEPAFDATTDGPTDAAELTDTFPFEPDPICETVAEPVEMGGGFVEVPSIPGEMVHVEDTDLDGRAEVFVFTNLDGEAPGHRDGVRTIYTWSEAGWMDEGDFVGLKPYGFLDLGDGPGTVMVGRERFLGQPGSDDSGIEVSIGARRDRPGDAFRYDEPVFLAAYERPAGVWRPEYQPHGSLVVLDGDGDGRPEILTPQYFDILEWQGDHFERVWRGSEADPYDPVREVGGEGLGNVLHGDFDGDGRVELILPDSGPEGRIGTGNGRGRRWNVRIFENRGDNDYALLTRLPLGTTGQMPFSATGDIDGDGRLEFLVGGGSPGSCLRYEIWHAPADDTYARKWRLDVFNPRDYPESDGAAVFGDLDGDGDDEFVVNAGQIITAWDWTGDTFRQIFGYRLCDTCQWSIVRTGDIDGDGQHELFFYEIPDADVAARQYLHPKGVVIFRMDQSMP